jgi:hypothetical protein
MEVLALAAANFINPPIEIGQEFHRWTIIGTAEPGKTGKKHWTCQCSCGTIKVVSQCNLYSGGSKSCGCFHNEVASRIHKTHGQSKTSEYKIWKGIKKRIFDEKEPGFVNYGGRGITMDKTWANSFEAFIAHIGPRPSRFHTVERKDNNKGYEPDNVKWATRKEQNNNKRSNHFVTYEGETLTIMAWSERKGISRHLLRRRVAAGYPEHLLFSPGNSARKLT